MFYRVLDPLRRRLGFRLSLWYVLVFTLSNAALFALTYYLLAAAIQDRERILLEAWLKQTACFTRMAASTPCASGCKVSRPNCKSPSSSGC